MCLGVLKAHPLAPAHGPHCRQGEMRGAAGRGARKGCEGCSQAPASFSLFNFCRVQTDCVASLVKGRLTSAKSNEG